MPDLDSGTPIRDRLDAIRARWAGEEPTRVLAAEARALLSECVAGSDDERDVRAFIALCGRACPW